MRVLSQFWLYSLFALILLFCANLIFTVLQKDDQELYAKIKKTIRLEKVSNRVIVWVCMILSVILICLDFIIVLPICRNAGIYTTESVTLNDATIYKDASFIFVDNEYNITYTNDDSESVSVCLPITMTTIKQDLNPNMTPVLDTIIDGNDEKCGYIIHIPCDTTISDFIAKTPRYSVFS